MVSTMVSCQIMMTLGSFTDQKMNLLPLYISRVVHPAACQPTLQQCVYYISRLALNDVTGTRLNPDPDSRISTGPDAQEESTTSGDDNSDDSDYDPKETRKQGAKNL